MKRTPLQSTKRLPSVSGQPKVVAEILTAFLLTAGTLMIVGCTPCYPGGHEDPLMWRKSSEIVQLNMQGTARSEIQRHFLGDSVSVKIALDIADPSDGDSKCPLTVYVQASSLVLEHTSKLHLTATRVYLQDGANRLPPSSESHICEWEDCWSEHEVDKMEKYLTKEVKAFDTTGFGGVFSSKDGFCLLYAEGEFCFDIDRPAPVGDSGSPIVIYLDSVVTFNKQALNLGRIELENYTTRTAAYVP